MTYTLNKRRLQKRTVLYSNGSHFIWNNVCKSENFMVTRKWQLDKEKFNHKLRKVLPRTTRTTRIVVSVMVLDNVHHTNHWKAWTCTPFPPTIRLFECHKLPLLPSKRYATSWNTINLLYLAIQSRSSKRIDTKSNVKLCATDTNWITFNRC